MKNKKRQVSYKYKDGRFLKTSYLGDGEYELILTNELTSDCAFPNDWDLDEILSACDSVYDDSGEYIADTLDSEDFEMFEVEITLK